MLLPVSRPVPPSVNPPVYRPVPPECWLSLVPNAVLSDFQGRDSDLKPIDNASSIAGPSSVRAKWTLSIKQ